VDTNRSVVARRVAAVLFAIGFLFIAAAILWPASSDALISASGVAAMAFGFPAGILFVFAYWLDAHGSDHEHHEDDDDDGNARAH
jgi:hypothetical protein